MLTHKSYHSPWVDVFEITHFSQAIFLGDHLGGFDKFLDNPILHHVNLHADPGLTVYTNYKFCQDVQSKFPRLNLKWSCFGVPLTQLAKYNLHPELDFQNFVCSFNGTAHVSRQLLTSMLYQFGYFNPDYSSKNFSYPAEVITGHLQNLLWESSTIDYYTKFFATDEHFLRTVYSFGHQKYQYEHDQNIHVLENKLTQSFLHIVSESMATSYYPFITEKFLYSVVTRGLYLAYAPPMWHENLMNFMGFKKYSRIFDYAFDYVKQPVQRLLDLLCMISRFSQLSVHDWQDLYQLERDTIEFNYDHYRSGNYQQRIECNE